MLSTATPLLYPCKGRTQGSQCTPPSLSEIAGSVLGTQELINTVNSNGWGLEPKRTVSHAQPKDI